MNTFGRSAIEVSQRCVAHKDTLPAHSTETYAYFQYRPSNSLCLSQHICCRSKQPVKSIRSVINANVVFSLI